MPAKIWTPRSRGEPLTAAEFETLGRRDHVTLLPNRLQFIDDFADLDRGGALLVMVTMAEAKHYNEVLRALGHAFCDDLVRVCRDRLLDLLGDGALFHVSVLSFAFVITGAATDRTPHLIEQIGRAFEAPLDVQEVPIKTHIGIGLLPLAKFGDTAEALRAALTAGHDSRRRPEGWAWYDHRSDEAHQRAFRLLADLPDALRHSRGLSLAFQPRIGLADGAVVGAEALLRWNHPELGPISPGEFVPLAEQTALIGPLTDWVIGKALETAGDLKRDGTPLRVSINASPANLSEPEFDARLLSRCAVAGIQPEQFELEFTEGMLAGNPERTMAQLERLRGAGIEVAIDDFGSGFANLSYLTTIPADVLKIDQSFVRGLGVQRGSDFLMRQIVEMARGLDFRVCVEGVETAEAYGFLKDLGCDEAQGYYMARPMSADALTDWLAAR
jgi:EAL domain-containing protein (putative c-di-GMP-specific phosphodiesterase class I)